MTWLKQRWSEPSTRAGLAAVAIAVGGIAPPGSLTGNIAFAAGVLFGGQAAIKRG
jgi:hypothetical protein